MTAHNRHLLAEGAHRVNRDGAARAERDAVVAFLRREADLRYDGPVVSVRDANEFAADVVAALAVGIENGDHRR